MKWIHSRTRVAVGVRVFRHVGCPPELSQDFANDIRKISKRQFGQLTRVSRADRHAVYGVVKISHG